MTHFWKVIEHKMCVLIFSTTFVILRRFHRGTTVTVQSAQTVLPQLYSLRRQYYHNCTVCTDSTTTTVQPAQTVLPQLYSLHRQYYHNCTACTDSTTITVQSAQTVLPQLYSLRRWYPLLFLSDFNET